MEVKVCKNCRRLFNYIYGPELCPDCAKLLAEEKTQPDRQKSLVKDDSTDATGMQSNQPLLTKGVLSPGIKPIVKDEEAKFEQVRDYIMAYPNASVAKISEVNDIPPTKLFEWIKDERLEFSENSEYAWFLCEKCGIKIKSGRLCNRCKTK